ncbi:B12-binding domain-containing protein [Flavobacterium sp. K5-23]|uniref:cobalamin B12-binding domain-containing protein n=1 Tax=Flavobacterium sp. K5-23 TaxID=2746225 RepID=UPI002010A157|nr:cobalamin-dependent protein [Flavobacterium sp. K5-23]UQD56712.1 cobalamin B12-binding domain-containing protein [Flavobacterium sp. K5-23]
MEEVVNTTYSSLQNIFLFDVSKEEQCKFDIYFALELLQTKDKVLITVGSLWIESIFQALNFDKNVHSSLFLNLELNLKVTHPDLAKLAVLAANVTVLSVGEYINREETLINNITNWHIKLFSKIDKSAIPQYLNSMKNDGQKHIDFIYESKENESLEIFVAYCSWVNSVLSSLKVETISLVRFLNTIKIFMNIQLIEEPFVYDIFINEGISSLLKQKNNDILMNDFTEPIHSEYLKLLLKGERQKAGILIHKLLDDGMDIKTIYLKIFQESQYEIGRLWEKNEISVAQEHYCTATTQMIMSQLYPKIFKENSLNKNIVATCVGDELHEIGVRIVADFLEMEGWNTYYLGANTPIIAIIEAIEEYKVDILAISVTMVPHVKNAKELIQEIREKSSREVKILVGGYPFHIDENLWIKIGADGFSKSAIDVHNTAIKLLKAI